MIELTVLNYAKLYKVCLFILKIYRLPKTQHIMMMRQQSLEMLLTNSHPVKDLKTN